MVCVLIQLSHTQRYRAYVSTAQRYGACFLCERSPIQTCFMHILKRSLQITIRQSHLTFICLTLLLVICASCTHVNLERSIYHLTSFTSVMCSHRFPGRTCCILRRRCNKKKEFKKSKLPSAAAVVLSACCMFSTYQLFQM